MADPEGNKAFPARAVIGIKKAGKTAWDVCPQQLACRSSSGFTEREFALTIKLLTQSPQSSHAAAPVSQELHPAVAEATAEGKAIGLKVEALARCNIAGKQVPVA